MMSCEGCKYRKERFDELLKDFEKGIETAPERIFYTFYELSLNIPFVFFNLNDKLRGPTNYTGLYESQKFFIEEIVILASDEILNQMNVDLQIGAKCYYNAPASQWMNSGRAGAVIKQRWPVLPSCSPAHSPIVHLTVFNPVPLRGKISVFLNGELNRPVQ